MDELHDGSESPEDGSLKKEVAKLFRKTFESFGYDQAKKLIEVSLIKDEKLYSIFFNWYYSQGFIDENARPKTTTADFYNKSPQKANQEYDEDKDDHSVFEDEFPLSNNYKVVESRPKTSMGLVVNTQKDSQDVASELIYLRDNNYTSSGNVKHSSDFDLSPSQTDHNEIRNEILTRSNANSILGRESEPNKPLTHFLTEEKNYDTLESHNDFSSKNYDPSLRDPDFNTISEPKRSESPRLVGVKSSSAPETLPNKSLPKIDESVLNAKIEKERKQLARDYEQKLQLIKLEHQKKVKEHEIMMIKQSEFDMNSLKDLEKEKQFMAEEVRELENKYKQADQEKLQLKEELSEMRGMMQKYERQQTEYIEKMNQQEEQKTLMNKQYVNFSSYAKQNISNPMDLSMSIVVKDGFKQQANHQDIVIKQEKLDELNNIFDRQKAIKDDDQDSDDEKTQRETVFKLQEYLTDTDDPNEITKPLLL